jgi:hypothetical protein
MIDITENQPNTANAVIEKPAPNRFFSFAVRMKPARHNNAIKNEAIINNIADNLLA